MVSNPTENLTTSKVLELIAVAAIVGVLMTVATQIVVVSAQKNGTNAEQQRESDDGTE